MNNFPIKYSRGKMFLIKTILKQTEMKAISRTNGKLLKKSVEMNMQKSVKSLFCIEKNEAFEMNSSGMNRRNKFKA